MAAHAYDTRIATPGDCAAVDALLQASYPVLMAPAYEAALLAPALGLMTKANMALLASGTYYIAESRDGAAVGCGGWTRERPGNGVVAAGVGHMRHFATHPQWTGRGIGRALYRLCERDARAAGVVVLECFASLNAAGFYRALGFERVGAIRMELGPGVALPAVLMRRHI